MNIKLRSIALGLVLLLSTFAASAQMVSHTVSVQAGYTNQTFYQMSSGVVSSVSNTDWDLGFQLRGFAASILINSKNNVQLYRANKDVSEWSSMTASDTTGYLNNPAYQQFNSDTSWDFGAFNVTTDLTNAFDLGWGMYDFATHAVLGDSIYFLKLSNGTVKKFMVESLTGGIYYFRTANVDGTGDTQSSISKAPYLGKFFVYYSVQNGQIINREPTYNGWDLSFAQYLTTTPYVYKVTGVLSNDSVEVAKAYPCDAATVTPSGLTFTQDINRIGFDWKTFDMNTFTYVMEDSTVYFVRDRAGAMWKMIFTGFDGSSTGNFYFDQEAVTATGLEDNSPVQTYGLYPNPAQGSTRLVLTAAVAGSATVSLIDISGRVVDNRAVQLTGGLQLLDLDLSACKSGLYQVVIATSEGRQTTRLVVE